MKKYGTAFTQDQENIKKLLDPPLEDQTTLSATDTVFTTKTKISRGMEDKTWEEMFSGIGHLEDDWSSVAKHR